MTKRLIIAEKPSVAKDVAEALAEITGERASKTGGLNGYWTVGSSWRVTWFFGHMFETAPPKAYNPAWDTWSLETLPMCPDKWKLVLNKEDRYQAQWPILQECLRWADEVVNAGDAGREGQLLVDEALYEAGWDPFGPKSFRLWMQSMARSDVVAAINGIYPNDQKRTLYYAAVCRQRADWVHGLNQTRNWTLLAQHSGLSVKVNVGRVMTPTLWLVVTRDLAIANFKPVDHYLPNIWMKHENGSFRAVLVLNQDMDGLDPEGRLVDRAVADRIVQQVLGKDGKVLKFDSSTKFTPPPLLYNLSALQTEASAKFGLSAKDTLEVAQALYAEDKIASYPRTESRHAPVGILREQAPQIMEQLAATDEFGELARGADLSLKSAVWNDKECGDHYGLLPTLEFRPGKLADLSDEKRKVFTLVVKTFLAQFYPPMKYKANSAEVEVEGHRFKASGRHVLDVGWKRIYGATSAADDDEADENDTGSVPMMARGDGVAADKAEVQAKRTQAPPEFTDGTLIEAMANIHRFMPDASKEQKDRLRNKEQSGIGTQATRAETIEKLLRLEYFRRKGKNKIVSTELGRSVIDVLPDTLTDPILTALWEEMLEDVEKGAKTPDAFMDEVKREVARVIGESRGRKIEIKGVKAVIAPGHGKPCPKCSQGELVTRSGTSKKTGKKFVLLQCSRSPSCDHVEWPDPEVPPLPGTGQPCAKCGKGAMKTIEITSKKDGKKYRLLVCDTRPACDHVVWPEPDVKPLPGHDKPCPKCSAGVMKTREITSKKDGKKYRLLSCNRRPECDHVEWPEPEVSPIEGHGKPCPKCGSLMKTKEITSKKDGKKYKLLSCSGYPKCDHSEWPERKVDPLPGDGKACAACGKGVMKTKEITKKDGTKAKLLSCTNYPACTASEWANDGKRPAAGGGGSGKGGSSSGKGGSFGQRRRG